jgi:hypothetical protein
MTVPPWASMAVLTPVATYFGGVLTKPLTEALGKRLDIRRDRSRLRKALYNELGWNYEHMCLSLIHRLNPNGSSFLVYPAIDQWERREVFDTALRTQPILFQELKEAKAFSGFYLQLARMKEMSDKEQGETLNNLSEWFNHLIKKGRLSRRRLNWSAPPSRLRICQELSRTT